MNAPKTYTLAKITRPSLPDTIHRKRLYHLLDQGRRKAALWVAGPGGSGKTTLVSGYLNFRKLPVLWYQMDESDGDISTFFYYMGLAAKKLKQRGKKPLPLLTSEYALGIGTFTRRYFESLFSRLKPPYVLVFDNYQDVPSGSGLHEIIRQGLSLVPEGIQIVLISRNEPPAMLARMQANNSMASLGWNDLRLEPAEIEELMRAKQGKKPGADVIRSLHETTDGWAAGLVLMMEGARQRLTLSPEQVSLPKEKIFEYFAAEVFDRLESKTRELFLKTAHFPKMTGAMARKATGYDKAEQSLSEFSRHNFFTTKHSHYEAAYQYHPLFRDFLLSRAELAFSGHEIISLKRRAAHILEEAGQGEAAVELFQKLGDWPEIARLICKEAPELAGQGRTLVLKVWLDRMPAEVVESAPWLRYWRGIAVMPLNPEESKSDFDGAFQLFKAQGDRAGMFYSWAGAVDAVFLGTKFIPLDELIATLEKMLRENRSFPSPEIEAHVTAGMMSALSCRQPFHPDVALWVEGSMNLLKTNSDLNLRIKTGIYLTVYNLWIGAFPNATLTLNILRELVKHRKATDLMKVTVKTTEALCNFFTASYEACLRNVFDAIKLGEETGVRVWEAHVVGHGIAAALSEGKLAEANTLFRRMDAGPLIRKFDRAYYHFMKVWQAMIEGNPANAMEQYNLVADLMKTKDHLYASRALYDILSFELLYKKAKRKAEHHLSQAYRTAYRMRSSILEFLCLTIDSHVAFSNDDGKKALRLLAKAFSLGCEKGFMNAHWWRPAVMSKLCAKALSAEIETEYVQELIRKRNLTPDEEGVLLDNWPYPIQIRTMGEFEIVKAGKQLVFTGKIQQKPLSLLKALIAFGGKAVSEHQLTDALWPEADGYSTHRSFESALYRLRILLGSVNALLLIDEKLTLNARYCTVDAWRLERLFENIDAGWKSIDETGKRKKGKKEKEALKSLISRTEKTLGQYQGHFLPMDAEQPWTASFRDRLRNRFISTNIVLGRYWEAAGQYEKSVACFQRGLEVDELSEELYQRLMTCQIRLGHKSEAARTYERCRSRLSSALNITPSVKTEGIYLSICKQW